MESKSLEYQSTGALNSKWDMRNSITPEWNSYFWVEITRRKKKSEVKENIDQSQITQLSN